jgi:hypothetical protein
MAARSTGGWALQLKGLLSHPLAVMKIGHGKN